MKAGHTERAMEMWEDILRRKKDLLLEQSFILHCNANNVMFQFTILLKGCHYFRSSSLFYTWVAHKDNTFVGCLSY
jgi:hypothetical protein